jgi:hypothetical protein
MTNLIDQIRSAQILAAEEVVANSLREKGLLFDEPPAAPVESRVVTFWSDDTFKIWAARDAQYAEADPGFLLNMPLASILAAAAE